MGFPDFQRTWVPDELFMVGNFFNAVQHEVISMSIHQSQGNTHRLLATALTLAAALPALPARSEPTGGVVTAGAGTISQQGATTTITQSATPRMVIDWKTFSTSSAESIVFRQPDASAISLNRVIGASPSQLMGSLSANGQVFILNPNGVLFGPGAQVNVRGLLASTLGMDNASFLAGNHTLQGSSQAKVINQGRLTAADGGYIALVGPAVINDGAVSARSGDALLAAGDKVTLSLEGGSLMRYSIDRGSVDALVDNSAAGLISASGGRVALAAGAADTLSRAVVNHSGVIEAQTLKRVEGSIRLMGDPAVGQLSVSGRLDASAPNGGNGGFIDTSAAKVTIGDNTIVNARASSGKSGTWLIDPVDFEIAAGAGAQTGSSIGAGALSNALAGSDVTIGTSTSAPGPGHGDITVNADVTWGANKLTLAAQRNINFNASLRGGSVSLLYGQASADGGTADYVFNNGAKINLNVAGGSFSTQKGSALQNLKTYNIVRSLGAQGSTDSATLQGMSNASAPHHVLGADINASATAGWNGGAGFTPLPALAGTLDGLGHTVDQLQIRGQDVVGLFSTTGQLAEVRNLGLTRVAISGDNFVGGVAGNNLGTIHRSYVTGAVTGKTRVGGLAGENNGAISMAYSEAAVKGSQVTGGLVGENASGAISNSYARGRVDGVDLNDPAASYTGGLVGFNRASISSSYASGSTAGIAGVGGLVGQSVGLIQDSYAQGAVSGGSIVGGLVGRTNDTAIIRNSYATGAVTGTEASSTRGLVGATDSVSPGLVSNSYWNTDVVGGTGQITPGAGEGRTGAQLQQAATFGAWDIAATGGTQQVWRIYEGHSMPLLRSFLAPLALGLTRGAKYSGAVQQNGPVPTAGPRTGVAASGRNVGTWQPYSNQQGYDISGGALEITKRPLGISAVAANKVYDSNSDASIRLSDDRVAGDTLTIDAAASFDNKHVGAAKQVTVSVISVTDTDAANYSYEPQVFSSASITRRPLIIDASAADKVYDGANQASLTISDNRVAGDDLTVTAVGAFDNKNVGTAKRVTASGVSATGTDAANYSHAPQLITAASITPRALDIVATSADRAYDGTTQASAALSDNRIAGDALAMAYDTARFADKNAGTGKPVIVSGVTLGGADAANYVYQPQLGTAASISPRTLDLAVTAADKVYDGTTRVSATLSDNRIAGDTLATSYQLANFVDKDVGTQKNVILGGITLSGSDAANYRVGGSAVGVASITPKSLSIIANPDSKLFDGKPYQGGNGVTFSGLVEGETEAVLSGQLRYGGDAQGAVGAGAYRITPGGLSAANYASTFVDGTLTISRREQPVNAAVAVVNATSSLLPAAALPATRSFTPGDTRVVDCGIRLPENVMLDGCGLPAKAAVNGRR